jgi:hypothetical protein
MDPGRASSGLAPGCPRQGTSEAAPARPPARGAAFGGDSVLLAVYLAVGSDKGMAVFSRHPLTSRFLPPFPSEPTVGLEPTTCCLQNSCSAIELGRRAFSPSPSRRTASLVSCRGPILPAVPPVFRRRPLSKPRGNRTVNRGKVNGESGKCGSVPFPLGGTTATPPRQGALAPGRRPASAQLARRFPAAPFTILSTGITRCCGGSAVVQADIARRSPARYHSSAVGRAR